MNSYDIVIMNGRVMDPETEYDAIANVGIRDNRIETITTEPIKGKTLINANGLVVAPGFIDTHYHWLRPIGYRQALLDGRTSVMDLEFGVAGDMVDSWYNEMDREGMPLNYGVGVSHELARSIVLDKYKPKELGDVYEAVESRKGERWSDTVADTAEVGNAILRHLDEGFQAGALAMSSTLGYMRHGVTAREAFEITRLAAAYKRPSAWHFRGTPGTDTEEANGIQELLANAVALEAPAIACHFNNPGYNVVHELLLKLQKLGHNVWGEYYPYTAGSTTINATFLEPENWVERLGYKYEETLTDVLDNVPIDEEMYHHYMATEPTRLVIVAKVSSEEAVVDWLRLKEVALASDAMPLFPGEDGEPLDWDTPVEKMPNSHPRGSGTYAEALALGRKHGVPLMHSIAQCSYYCAKRLGKCGIEMMDRRGRMQENMIADITIFDPEKVKSLATYASGNLNPIGIPFVIVSGQVVVKDSKPIKGLRCGKPIRYEPCESRFEEVNEKKWKQEHYVPLTPERREKMKKQTFSLCC